MSVLYLFSEHVNSAISTQLFEGLCIFKLNSASMFIREETGACVSAAPTQLAMSFMYFHNEQLKMLNLYDIVPFTDIENSLRICSNKLPGPEVDRISSYIQTP